MSRMSPAIRTWALCALCVMTLAPAAAAQSQTVTAVATITTAGGASARAPLTVAIRQFSTDAERDELVAAIAKGGTASARALLARRGDAGPLQLGAKQTAIKYAYARTTGSGHLITVVTAEPIVFVGAGVPGAKPKEGYDLGLVMLEVDNAGPGRGEVVPAAKVKVNDQGAIVTEDYGADVMRLSDVVRK